MMTPNGAPKRWTITAHELLDELIAGTRVSVVSTGEYAADIYWGNYNVWMAIEHPGGLTIGLSNPREDIHEVWEDLDRATAIPVLIYAIGVVNGVRAEGEASRGQKV
jgi:hypothetical protein